MHRTLFLVAFLTTPLFAQSPPPPITGVPGPLVIVGGGGMPESVRRAFVELAGKDKAKIVVIPTASADAGNSAQVDSFREGWLKLSPASVTVLHAKDEKEANDETFLKPLTEATAVWFSGGDQSRIIARYRGTKFESTMMTLHRKGVVIGGTSAGAAIMTPTMITGGRETATLGTGFDLLPGFLVDQHFIRRNRKARLVGAMASKPGLVGLGIDEATAAVVTGRTIKVVGESTVSIFLTAGAGREQLEQTLKPGQVADLIQLRRAAANRVSAQPFPPKSPTEPMVKSGALVVVGGGGLPKSITDRFIELAGGKEAPLVVIPTAMEDPIATHAEESLFRRLGMSNVTILHTRDRNVANDPDFSKALLTAKAVWFGGGRQWRFVDAYEATLTEKRFHEVLDRGGVIGGSSAGASIQSEYMPRGHPLGNTVVDAEGYERGFGFLRGCAVDQHFFARNRTRDMTGLMTRYPPYLGIGIDEATAIVVKGSVAEVIGRSKVGFYDWSKGKPSGDQDYIEVKTGESFDLIRRAKR